MNLARISRRLAPAVLALALVACGGSSGGGGAVGVPGSDPVATVNSLVATIQAKAFDKLPDLACSTSKSSIGSSFDFSGALGSSLPGVTATDVLAAMTVTLDSVTVGQPSISGDTATVHLKGNLTVTFDKTLVGNLIKKYMTIGGQVANDALVNAALSQMSGQLTHTTTMDNDLTLKNEGGKWLVCQ